MIDTDITQTATGPHRVRKLPVEVEALQLRWDTWSAMCDFAGVGKLTDGKPEGVYLVSDGDELHVCDHDQYPGEHAVLGLAIPTLEGVMIGAEGDWIIKGVKGELYPCKPGIFAETYEVLT